MDFEGVVRTKKGTGTEDGRDARGRNAGNEDDDGGLGCMWGFRREVRQVTGHGTQASNKGKEPSNLPAPIHSNRGPRVAEGRDGGAIGRAPRLDFNLVFLHPRQMHFFLCCCLGQMVRRVRL